MFRVGYGCSVRSRPGTLSFTRSLHLSTPLAPLSKPSSVGNATDPEAVDGSTRKALGHAWRGIYYTFSSSLC